MVKCLFRYFLVIAVLMLLFGFVTKGFSNSLVDAYNILIANGWTVKDALGFLGASIAGTLALNPSVAPAVAAAALSAYIALNGAYLYDLYREWRNARSGIALLNPVDVSESMSVKRLRNGESGWTYIRVFVRPASGYWDYVFSYSESYNDSGEIKIAIGSGTTSGRVSRDAVINEMNKWLQYRLPTFRDQEGITMFTSYLQAAYSNLLSNNSYSVSYSRQVVPALEINSRYGSSVGYKVNVNPNSISEDGVQYLGDSDAFFNWFVTNYMNGTNEGIFVTPLNDAYDGINSKLQTILEKLNILSGSGGISEERLNELKSEIMNAIATANNTSESNILNTLYSKFGSLDSTLETLDTDINSKFGTLQDDIASVRTAIDTLTSEMNETQQQEQGFWDRLFEWLDNNLWTKLKEFLSGQWFKDFLISLYRLLVVPENAAEIWNITVSRWVDMVKWDDVQMPTFRLSGNVLGVYSIPLGSGSIPLKIGEYVSQTGLRDLITGMIVFSMWFGFLLKLLPRFYM